MSFRKYLRCEILSLLAATVALVFLGSGGLSIGQKITKSIK